MREYTHTSRLCRLEELKPELVSAIREFIAKHTPLLEDVEQQALICVETTNEQVKIGLLDRLTSPVEKVYYTGALVTPGYLIWATCGPRRKAAALAARLVDLEITRLDYGGVRDPGLDFFALMLDHKERETAYIGLGNDAAGVEFTRVLNVALDKAYM